MSDPATPKPPSGRVALASLVLALLLAAGLLALLRGGIDLGPLSALLPSADPKSAAAPPPRGAGAAGPPAGVPVAAAVIGRADFVDRIEAIGTARANESITVTAKVTDTISRIAFEDGMAVEAGQILVELTDEETAAELEQARASLREAERDFSRVADLVKGGSASRKSLDAALAASEVAKARVGAIEARLKDRIIRAPFAGVLGLRLVSVGSLLRPGDPITTLDDIATIKVDFSVPERFFATMTTGLALEAVTAAYPGRRFEGRVLVADSRIDPVTRAVTVRAEIDNREGLLRAGMLLVVGLESAKRTALALPEDALVPVMERMTVFRILEGRAVATDITIGARLPGAIEVLEGLAEGDRVVVEGTNRVRNGMPVRVVRERRPGESGEDPPPDKEAMRGSP